MYAVSVGSRLKTGCVAKRGPWLTCDMYAVSVGSRLKTGCVAKRGP